MIVGQFLESHNPENRLCPFWLDTITSFPAMVLTRLKVIDRPDYLLAVLVRIQNMFAPGTTCAFSSAMESEQVTTAWEESINGESLSSQSPC